MIAINAVALLASVYLADLYQLTLSHDWLLIRSRLMSKAVVPWNPQTGDNRSKFQVVMDDEAAGLASSPTFHPALVLDNALFRKAGGNGLLPLANPSYRQVVFCNEEGEWLRYVSDEHGFNNPPGIWSRKSAKTVLIGDSFVEGQCVSPGRTIAALLRHTHPSTVSLGRGGSGPLIELALLREYAAALRPRNLVWFYYEENDLPRDLDAEKRSQLLMRYLKDAGFNQGLLDRQETIDRLLDGFTELMKREVLAGRQSGGMSHVRDQILTGYVQGSHRWIVDTLLLRHLRHDLMAGIKSRFQRPQETDDQANDERLRLFADIMSEANREVLAWGGRLTFVYLPGAKRYFSQAWVRNDGYRFHDRVLDTVAGLGIPTVDLTPVFSNEPAPTSLFFHAASHYNERGYALVSEAVLPALQPVRLENAQRQGDVQE